MIKKVISLSLALSLTLASAGIIFAQTPNPTRISMIKARADAEIERRVISINDVIGKISSLKRLSDSDKTNFTNEANTEISNLNNLKTKIDADTDLATLRADQKSIFDEYRVYLLFIPQMRILVAADRMSATDDLMNTVATKLQGRINGNSSLQATLNGAVSKLTDAKTQYANAESSVIGLTPDKGDAGVAASNKQAILTGRNDLQAGLADLKAARADFQTIVSALKAASPTATP